MLTATRTTSAGPTDGMDRHAHIRMATVDGISAPEAPRNLPATGIDSTILADLALKTAYTVPHFTTDWAMRQLRLPLALAHELMDQLRHDRLIEMRGQVGPFNYQYAVTQRGCERVARLLEISGYIGPAPVSLASYTAMLNAQMNEFPRVTPDRVDAAIAELVLAPDAVQLAGLAVSSGRSLFVFGPPGNGKTSLGRLLHNAAQGELWIPHCISIESNIIRVFDPQLHELVEGNESSGQIDHRWVRIRRPLIVVGGEATLDSFELTYSPSLRYYEAPQHFKANGGTFLIDDFGRERVDPLVLLNRLITPLEHQVDYLTLTTGQKILVPLRQMFIVATNLRPESVTDPAFLRRMGYRLYLGEPSPEQYARIFKGYAARCGVEADPPIIEGLLARYRAEKRELRGCEPRDLIERARDICRFRSQPLELSEDVLRLAWTGYFGNKQ